MTVRVLFHSFLGEPVARSLFLLTYAIPSNDKTYDCHACAPVIGMAVFSQNGQKWHIDASNRAVTFAGEWGKPPKDIQLVTIGPNHVAAKIVDVGKETGGETTEVLELCVPWNGTVNLALQRIIADDDKGGCDPEGVPCYGNRRQLSFVGRDDTEYYDIELRLSGSDVPLDVSASHQRKRQVSGLEVFRFDNGMYRQVSKDGDTTSLDEWMAKQKRKGPD